MLVLSRHRDETVMIGDEIELTVVDIRGDKVRIGIKAPTRVPVHRKEIYEAIRRENEASLELPSAELPTERPVPLGVGVTAVRRPQSGLFAAGSVTCKLPEGTGKV